jgi:hypothetical protein
MMCTTCGICMTSKNVRRDIYVVHSMRSSWAKQIHEEDRKEWKTYGEAFKHFKWHVSHNHEAGLFHWAADAVCTRLTATEGYNIPCDLPPN